MFNILEGNTIYCSEHDHYIPLDPANRHYQEVLDAIIEQGADCFEGDIPADLQTAADAKQFSQQLSAYRTAVTRLAQYQLSVGVPESTQTITTGMQEWNEETMQMEDVTETFVVPAIEPLEATVEVTTYEMGEDPVTTTVPNPLIVKDNEERAEAQAVIDATPQAVIDAA